MLGISLVLSVSPKVKYLALTASYNLLISQANLATEQEICQLMTAHASKCAYDGWYFHIINFIMGNFDVHTH